MRLVTLMAGLFAMLAFGASAQQLGGLASFSSDSELRGYVIERLPQDGPPQCPPDWEVCPGYDPGQGIVITGSRVSTPVITNNQEAGVDEGDIVKMSGDHLVILRRGRLFTVDTSRGGLRPVAWIDAFPPGVEAEDDWYDEMLVADGWVVVVGYSYERETTEINRFRIDQAGRLTFVDSHRLSANDYYSSRNYSSRLVGERLVIYSPFSVEDEEDPLERVPTLARWRSEGRSQSAPLLTAQDIHRTPALVAGYPPSARMIHSIVTCDLTARILRCEARAVLGPEGRVVYVSPSAAYIWLTDGVGEAIELFGSAVFRLPHDGGDVRMARVWGGPVDQLSFVEEEGAGLLRVLVTASSYGEAMWDSDVRGGAAALLSLPLSRFGDGSEPPVEADYRQIGAVPENARAINNRFVGDFLLYSVSSSRYGDDMAGSLVSAVRVDGGPISSWMFGGAVERVEAMGRDALVVHRSPQGVAFTTLNLVADGDEPRWHSSPRISHSLFLEDLHGAETRSHAFFYQPDEPSGDGEFGTFGLPVRRRTDRDNGLFDDPSDMAFVRRGNDRLALAGSLDAGPEDQVDDRCPSSCIDWYGDARPIFVGGRIFALLGYELVEGRLDGRAIIEVQRANIASVLPIR